MDVTLNHFFTIEPHSRASQLLLTYTKFDIQALGITAEKGKEFIDWIVSKSLKYPHSYRIVHKETKKV